MSDLPDREKRRRSLTQTACKVCVEKDRRIEQLERRLREEIMASYDSLTATRKARYKGPEDYADAVLSSERWENGR